MNYKNGFQTNWSDKLIIQPHNMHWHTVDVAYVIQLLKQNQSISIYVFTMRFNYAYERLYCMYTHMMQQTVCR